MSKVYDASSIQILKNDRERVQQQPHIYTDVDTPIFTLREIYDNSVDEVLNAGGSIDVSYNGKTKEFSVTDTGRGIPLEKLKELCEILNSSGKFEKGDDNAYSTAGGLHGVGMKLACYLSDYCIVTSRRDGLEITRSYKDGYFIKETKNKSSEHGTTITCKLSDKYFNNLDDITCEAIIGMVEEKTDCCPGLEIAFKGSKEDGTKVKQKFTGVNTEQLFKKYCSVTSKTWFFDKSFDDTKDTCRLGFGWNAKAVSGSGDLYGWCNFIRNNDGGTHVDAIGNAIYDYMKKYMYKDFLSEKDKKALQLRKEDVLLGLSGVIVITSPKPKYYGQFKQKMNSEPIGNEIENYLKKKFDKMTDEDLRKIATILRDNIKARMSSIKARQQVKKIGNGFSDDAIKKYIPKKMSCDVDYLDVYIVEGDSAGNQVESARYPYSSIYKLRGKVDAVYNCTTQELLKKDIIQDLSRIFGILPGKEANPNDIIPDAVHILTDADADGYSIRAGLICIIMRAFPQIVTEGRLFVVEPPLFGFTDEGKQMFVSTNREYVTYLQKKFSKNNDLYFNKQAYGKSQVQELLLRNEQYLDTLKKLSTANICTTDFMELICANISRLGNDKKRVSDWDELIKKKFSPQLSAVWNNDDSCIEISGIKDGDWNMIQLTDEFIESKKTKKMLKLINTNMGNIYGYTIEGVDAIKNASLSKILSIFDKYEGSNKTRYKGLSLGQLCSNT